MHTMSSHVSAWIKKRRVEINFSDTARWRETPRRVGAASRTTRVTFKQGISEFERGTNARARAVKDCTTNV